MPANDYYDSTNVPATGAAITSATLRSEYNLIESAFNKCPPLTGNGGKVVIVNAGGTALTADSFASLASGALALKANVADAVFTGLTTIPQLKLDATTLTVSGAELNFVDGVTSAIQTQLNAKAPLTGTAAGLTAGNVTTNANLTGPVTSVGNATAIADNALSIAKTSGLQAALNAKAPVASPTFTGTVTLPVLFGTDANIAGQLNLTGDLIKSRSESGADSWISVANTSNTANSGALLRAEVAGASAGDAWSSYYVAGVTAWSVGLDNSDSDKFKISSSLILGTSDALRIDPLTNLVELTGGLNITGGSAAVGTIWFDAATSGLQLQAKTGVTNDFRILSVAGNPVLRNPTGTDDVAFGGALLGTGTGGLGYGTDAGGTVTQATSKTTSVTLNKICGRITMHNAGLAAGTSISFTLNNTLIGENDVVIASIKGAISSNIAYQLTVSAVGAAFTIFHLRNVSAGWLSEAVVINFSVIKGVAS